MKFTIEEIIKTTDAQILYKTNLNGTFSISTDTRKIKTDEIYLPLRGENFDGHNFINKALQLGARGYFTQDKHKIDTNAKFVLYVKNTLVAYLQLANYIRKKYNPITLAITGSSGKTTTKEMLASVCEVKYKTHKSKLNHNNEIGLCETILSMPVDTEVLILEMGMRNLGEIELLSKYAEPDVAIITNVGRAHVGRLGNVENIAKAKCEIVSYLNHEGKVITKKCPMIEKCLNFESEFSGKKVFIDFDKIKILSSDIEKTDFIYRDTLYTLNTNGKYNVENASLVIEAGKTLGLSSERITEGLKKYKPIESRWQIINIGNLKFINDSYNSNPDSLSAVLKAFLETYKPPLTVVLGDMAELGKDEIKYHREIGEFLSKYEDVKIVTVGELSKYIAKSCPNNSVSFEKKEDAVRYLKESSPKNSTILLKASRLMKFETIIEDMKLL